MSDEDADEIFKLVIELFKECAPDRAYRIRGHFADTELSLANAKELVYQHRETVEYLTEKILLAAISQATGKRKLDPATEASIARQQAQKEEWHQEIESDYQRIRRMKELPADVIAELRSRALTLLPTEIMRRRIETLDDPFSSPTLTAFMLQARGSMKRLEGVGA